MLVPKLIGVFGLFTLPANVLSAIIFVIVAIYSVSYIINRPFRSNSKAVDVALLMAGGYISGTSLIGAPLIIAVAANHVAREKLRDTFRMNQSKKRGFRGHIKTLVGQRRQMSSSLSGSSPYKASSFFDSTRSDVAPAKTLSLQRISAFSFLMVFRESLRCF